MVGALWSAFAGGLAANTSLRVLRLAYCGLGAVGAAALAPALMQVRAARVHWLVGMQGQRRVRCAWADGTMCTPHWHVAGEGMPG